jgi:hypothetical protein
MHAPPKSPTGGLPDQKVPPAGDLGGMHRTFLITSYQLILIEEEVMRNSKEIKAAEEGALIFKKIRKQHL